VSQPFIPPPDVWVNTIRLCATAVDGGPGGWGRLVGQLNLGSPEEIVGLLAASHMLLAYAWSAWTNHAAAHGVPPLALSEFLAAELDGATHAA
jgi:hypothetical protein